MNLADGLIILRSFRETDSVRMAELANNEKISRNLRDGFHHPYTIEDARNFLKMFLNQEVPSVFAIEFNGEYVGNIGLHRCSDVYRFSAEIGYFLGEPYWNRGIMTTAVNLITEYGLKELGLVRIHTGIFEYNPASMRVLEKCGYVKEAIFRKSVFKMGRFWDEVRYAKINPDYLSSEICQSTTNE
jgi:[ribosomal protein S5]-alanine N-acetyltransferase